MLVLASRTLSQFPSKATITCQNFRQCVNAVLQRIAGEKPFGLALSVKSPLWFIRFVLVNVKTALDVVFENNETLPLTFASLNGDDVCVLNGTMLTLASLVNI